MSPKILPTCGFKQSCPVGDIKQVIFEPDVQVSKILKPALTTPWLRIFLHFLFSAASDLQGWEKGNFLINLW